MANYLDSVSIHVVYVVQLYNCSKASNSGVSCRALELGTYVVDYRLHYIIDVNECFFMVQTCAVCALIDWLIAGW